ncbi:hypothetical protein [Plantibacter sp. CFBP 13570]|uniref:hypothetical protein n=1 Tax=Plantibacter sp. CFBP 13570 TaxID=2775272 RepID=UPI001930E0E1|nr:hypothetical protein [Plantibacter sp. CFBP 13570]MBD8535657.1 hypothetical protein [Plantibacter sp. CFBP 13570]
MTARRPARSEPRHRLQLDTPIRRTPPAPVTPRPGDDPYQDYLAWLDTTGNPSFIDRTQPSPNSPEPGSTSHH